MKKIHVFSHHGYAITKNNKQFDITMCGQRGNNIKLSNNMSEITCSRCKQNSYEFIEYANKVIKFKVGDIYKRDIIRSYEIKSVGDTTLNCYLLNSEFKRTRTITVRKNRLACYKKIK